MTNVRPLRHQSFRETQRLGTGLPPGDGIPRLDELREVELIEWDVPWHGLGTKVLPDLTPDQMLKAAGLDWEVEKRDVTYEGNHGERKRASNKKALVRTSDGSFLDMVSSEWNPLQNAEAFSFFNAFYQSLNFVRPLQSTVACFARFHYPL